MALNMARGMLLAVAVIMVLVLVSGRHSAGAQTVEATWRLHDRAGESTFAAGANAITPGGGPEGYEIVSFDAVPVDEGLATYEYGAADLDEPMPQLIACEATFTPTAMSLQVEGAYPYAGCVFFLGAENTGDEALQVDLGGLDDRAETACDTPGCEASDVAILGGGPDTATIGELCHASGDVSNSGGLSYELQPGATFVCPLFVTVLQPANEGTTYQVTIEPPPPDSSPFTPEETPEDTPEASPAPTEPLEETPGPTEPPEDTPDASPAPTEPQEETPEPGATYTPTPALTETPTHTPTAVSTVAGERTPGPDENTTPIAPDAGTGQLVVQGESGGAVLWLVVGFMLSTVGALVLSVRRG